MKDSDQFCGQHRLIFVAYRADLVVEDKVIVELKSVEEVTKVHKKQLKTYLKLADKRLGLLIGFGAIY